MSEFTYDAAVFCLIFGSIFVVFFLIGCIYCYCWKKKIDRRLSRLGIRSVVFRLINIDVNCSVYRTLNVKMVDPSPWPLKVLTPYGAAGAGKCFLYKHIKLVNVCVVIHIFVMKRVRTRVRPFLPWLKFSFLKVVFGERIESKWFRYWWGDGGATAEKEVEVEDHDESNDVLCNLTSKQSSHDPTRSNSITSIRAQYIRESPRMSRGSLYSRTSISDRSGEDIYLTAFTQTPL